MKPMTIDQKNLMDTIQKVLQFGYALALGLIGWIAKDALATLEDIQHRQVINEREDAVRESRLSSVERQLDRDSNLR